MTRRSQWIAAGLAAVALLATPSPAAADITAFLGVNGSPSSRTAKGFAFGAGLLIVGFEFEYAHTNEDPLESAPSLRTYMFNGLVQMPVAIGGLQFYGTAGGGGYQESLKAITETSVGANVGGGVKMSLAGPLRLRVDYRVFSLKGSARYPNPQRFYVGINLKF